MLTVNDVRSSNTANFAHSAQQRSVVKKKWTILITSFLTIMLVGCGYLLSLSPEYQSEAKIGLSNDNFVAAPNTVNLLEQFGRIREQLTRYDFLSKVKIAVEQKYSHSLGVAELNAKITVTPDLASRSLTVSLSDNEALKTQQLLSELLNIFFEQHNLALKDGNNEQLLSIEKQLVELDAQIKTKKAVLNDLALENKIVSFERDENQILSLLKDTTAKLNETITKVDAGQDLIEKINLARELGTNLLHPEDEALVTSLKASISTLESELAGLSREYTDAYLALDPNIVEKKATLKDQIEQLQDLQTNSTKRFEQETQLQLALDKKSVATLQSRIDEINAQARAFNFKLQEYKQLSTNLDELVSQRNFMAQQLEAKKQSKELQLVLQQAAFLPDAPIGPNYLLLIAYLTLIASCFSLACLILYSYIIREPQTTAVNNVTVVPQDKPSNHSLTLENQYAVPSLSMQQAEQSMAQLEKRVEFTTLSQQQIQLLYDSSNDLTKCIIILAMVGLSDEELSLLTEESLDQNNATLSVLSQIKRTVSCQFYGETAISYLTENLTQISTLTKEEIHHALVNSAFDAGFAQAEQFDFQLLRNTLMLYLVSNGMKINQLEQKLGYVSPQWLAPLREYVRNSQSVDPEQLNYPLTV